MLPNVNCQICEINPSKYKCPSCSIRYCSLACYKNNEKHCHDKLKMEETTKPATSTNKSSENTDNTTGTQSKVFEQISKPAIPLATEEFENIYQTTPTIQELLQYNTVKFHLAKVYRILNSDPSNEESTPESRKQLAIDYLNLLRCGGPHYNEAIEEFCQILLEKIR
ncbi:hypothetical protein TBLA_0D03770 [Henningerozyma blattae CBS 6284]|uniref:HIT-type domain-containing protein n=1 Tax=Henningerozyma blattae (strain ATCC 34711 / CBS 6284 / DSM 70876 / NBRC 10599 / NRRL Y-10934 / UCD 77-7) TaxID=1071380 RepID=I2H3C4_HENB6|nr:hypothetical protein TBLA_0D03770 [Tetrapisispora blattae CBS 6284]CCH60876.1 hypothetical protein TBLA_0D03770 [Tetrapisispora blattae CBS 6284]